MTVEERLGRIDKALDWIILMLFPMYRADEGTMEIDKKAWDKFLKERGLHDTRRGK